MESQVEALVQAYDSHITSYSEEVLKKWMDKLCTPMEISTDLSSKALEIIAARLTKETNQEAKEVVIQSVLAHLNTSQLKSREEFDRARIKFLELQVDWLVQEGELLQAMEMMEKFMKVYEKSPYFEANEACRIYVKATELYLEESNFASAEYCLNKTTQFIAECQDELTLIKHKVSYARILDGKQLFLPAASRYYELSISIKQINKEAADEENLLEVFLLACTCMILSPYSSDKTKLLEKICSNDRFKDLAEVSVELKSKLEVVKDIILRMQQRCILKLTSPEIIAFRSVVSSRQLRGNKLETAIHEHNIACLQYRFRTISLLKIANLTYLSLEQVFQVLCKMISEGRLKAMIHEREKRVTFTYINYDLEHYTNLGDARAINLCKQLDIMLASNP